jgi:hypothetical protein
MRNAIERDGTPNNFAIATEAPPPESVAETDSTIEDILEACQSSRSAATSRCLRIPVVFTCVGAFDNMFGVLAYLPT